MKRFIFLVCLFIIFCPVGAQAEITDAWVDVAMSDEVGILIGDFTCELTDPSGNTATSCTSITLSEEGIDIFYVTVAASLIDEGGVWALHMYTSGNTTEWAFATKYVTVTDGASTDQISVDEAMRTAAQIRRGKRYMTGTDVREYDYDGVTELTDKTCYDSAGSPTSDPNECIELRPK